MDARPTAELPEHPNPGHTGLQVRVRVPRASGFTLDVDARLAGRGITAVFGPSGCGKTTLLSCLAGIQEPTSGHIRIDDLDLTQLRMIATAPFGNIVVQTSDIHQPRFTQLCHDLIGQLVLMQMLLQGKAAQIAHHHQDVLIDRINMK